MRRLLTVAIITCFSGPAAAQYAVGHRTFGGGTAFGGGYWKMDYQFPGVDSDEPVALLPTI